MNRSRTLAAAAAVLASLAAGCGSDSDSESKPDQPAQRSFPPAAEPGTSPPLTETPAGEVRRLPASAEGVAVDPGSGRVAVGLRNPDELAIIDGGSGRVVRRVKLEESPRHLLLAKEPGVVLVPAERADKLIDVDVREQRVVSTTPVGTFPHAVIQAGDATFVADEMGGTISVVHDGRVVETLRGLMQPGGMAVAAGRMGVVDVRTRRLTVYDLESLRAIATLPAGVGSTHAVADAPGRIVVADTQGRALLLFTLAGRPRLQRRVPVPGTPYGIAVDPTRGIVWVTLTSSNRLLGYRIDAAGRARVVADHPTIRQPNTVAVDPAANRVFVASRTTNELQTIRVR